MDFKKLDLEIKENLSAELLNYVEILGGKNALLKMIEEIREIKPNPLLNKSGAFHTSKVKISLSKVMYKDTFSALFDAIRREEKNGDMLNDTSPKDYKNTMNMMRALKSVSLKFESKDDSENSFSFPILDTSCEKKTKVTFMFKAFFFYNLNEAKKVLSFSDKNNTK